MPTPDAYWIIRGIVFKTYVGAPPSQLPTSCFTPPTHTYRVWITKWGGEPAHKYFLEHTPKHTPVYTTALDQFLICPVGNSRSKADMIDPEAHTVAESVFQPQPPDT